MRASRWIAFLLAVPLLLGNAPAKEVKEKGLTPEPFAMGETSPSWDGPQFVRADRKGNVFLFRGNAFEVYALGKHGELEEPVALKRTEVSARFVHDAVLSASGERWLVLDGISPRLFDDGKEKPVPPLSWRPWSITFLGETPLVSVLPVWASEGDTGQGGLSSAPWIFSLGSRAWEPLVENPDLSVEEAKEGRGGQNELVARYALFLAGDRRGKLWVGRQYSYTVEHWSAGGRRLLSLVVDGGEVKHREQPAAVPAAARRQKAAFSSFTAEPVIRDLAEARDGRLYLLVRTPGGGLAVDRYDPVRSVMERVRLNLDEEGRFSMAAGRDALHFAAWNGRRGRWKLSWEALDAAAWKEIEGAEVSGGVTAP
jgi:hypothetical protein